MWKKQLAIVLVASLTTSIVCLFIFDCKQPDSSPRTRIFIAASNRSKPPRDQFTICLLDAHTAFEQLSLPWFLAFGTALMYHRSNNFVSDDIDIGIFIDDFTSSNISSDMLLSTVRQHGFKLLHTYGNMSHGQGWTLACPRSQLHFGIFVFYRANPVNNETFAWWTASYNGPCSRMRYRKCRWWFSDFAPERLTMYERHFRVAPVPFLVEQYGTEWMSPRQYGYFESLAFLPNLIDEY